MKPVGATMVVGPAAAGPAVVGDARRSGRWLGATLVELLVVLAVIALVMALALPAVLAVRRGAAAAACRSNLRQMGLALTSYVAAHRVFPFGVGSDGDRAVNWLSAPEARRYSVQSQLLPYLGEEAVYDALNFRRPPFAGEGLSYADEPGGANATAARTTIAGFLCPRDEDRLAEVPFAKTNYRACSGSTPAARGGNDGLFGQISSVRHGQVSRGLSKVAAFSERVRGRSEGKYDRVDPVSDLVRPFRWKARRTHEELVAACRAMTDRQALRLYRDVEGGRTWLEGNMNWTRYNHVLPPGDYACKLALTWLGTVMPPSSHHGTVVHVCFGDGSVRPIDEGIDEDVWGRMGRRRFD